MIPYGADVVVEAEPSILKQYGLEPDNYAILIARPEPENSILEIISAFSCKKRGKKLAVLGNYLPNTSEYHKHVKQAASDEVVFLGAIYDKPVIKSLRFHALLYLHGHRVGGTNPSLVEALAAGSPILAHDNIFNRWVAGPSNHYFKNEEECAAAIDELLDNQPLLQQLRKVSWEQYQERFTWEKILSEYETLIQQHA
jgi:glycosyltransferase involved in cell wall biosynthesis